VTIIGAVIGACGAIIAAVISLQGAPTINVFTGSSASASSGGSASSPRQSAPVTASSAESATDHTATKGTITWPINGATDVKHASPLHASGTVQDLQPGHQLLLFLNFANENLYYGGDPSPSITLTTGKWSVVIFIGGNRQPGQQFRLYLVDLGPHDKLLVDNQNNPDWNSGFPASILWGQGEQVLYSLTFTTD
jgi:hypothetical protein